MNAYEGEKNPAEAVENVLNYILLFTANAKQSRHVSLVHKMGLH